MRPLARPPFWGRARRSLGRSLGHSLGRATESQIPLKRVRGRQQPKSAMFNIRDKLLEPFSPLPRTALENAQPVRGRQEPHIAIAIRFLFRKHFFARLQNARVSFPFFQKQSNPCTRWVSPRTIVCLCWSFFLCELQITGIFGLYNTYNSPHPIYVRACVRVSSILVTYLSPHYFSKAPNLSFFRYL